jgi:hypothetical protein
MLKIRTSNVALFKVSVVTKEEEEDSRVSEMLYKEKVTVCWRHHIKIRNKFSAQ